MASSTALTPNRSFERPWECQWPASCRGRGIVAGRSTQSLGASGSEFAMGYTQIDALRISPNYTANDWLALDQDDPADWRPACEMVKDRLDGRFLRYASNCLRSPHSGFVVLAIDSLLLEAIQQFREGIVNGHGQSQRLVTEFLKGRHFQPEFDAAARLAFYCDIRCGLLHQAEARRMWLVRRDQASLLAPFPHGNGYIIDVRCFHKGVRMSQMTTWPRSEVPRTKISGKTVGEK